MRKPGLWGAALAVAGALGAGGGSGCGQQAADRKEQVQSVEVYDVPPSQVQSVRMALDEVLRANDTGSAADSNGRLVVMAPEGTQASISNAIEALAGIPAADEVSSSEAPLQLRFWLVNGNRQEGAADPRLDSLAPVLAETSRSLGLESFELQGFTQILASPGRKFTSRSGTFHVDGDAALTSGGVDISVDFNIEYDVVHVDQIQTDVVLKPGQSVVLGTADGPDGNMRVIIAQAETAAGGS